MAILNSLSNYLYGDNAIIDSVMQNRNLGRTANKISDYYTTYGARGTPTGGTPTGGNQGNEGRTGFSTTPPVPGIGEGGQSGYGVGETARLWDRRTLDAGGGRSGDVIWTPDGWRWIATGESFDPNSYESSRYPAYTGSGSYPFISGAKAAGSPSGPSVSDLLSVLSGEDSSSSGSSSSGNSNSGLMDLINNLDGSAFQGLGG